MDEYVPHLRSREALTPCHGQRCRFAPGVTGTFIRFCKICGRRYEVVVTEGSLARSDMKVLRSTWTHVGWKTKKAERAADGL